MMVLNLKRTTTTWRPLSRTQPRPRVALAFATILSLCLITVVFKPQLFFNNFNDQSDKFIMDDSSTEVERAGEVENMIEGAETPTRTLPNGSTSEGSTYHSIIDSKSPSPTQVKIYVFGTEGKKAQSMFRTGHLDRFGSGRIEYVLEQRDNDCKHSGATALQDAFSCLAMDSIHNQECSYDQMTLNYPTCKSMLTNDEFCADNRYDARGYYSSALADKAYLPLGPRYDAWEAFGVLMNQNVPIMPASQRKYAFNAIYSLSTNEGRAVLEEVIQKEGGSLSSFVQISPEWVKNPNSAANPLADTRTYVQVLLGSIFTFAPAGHNFECFRLYEAVEAGSIPVISIDKDYREHRCKDSLSHWTNSPIIIVESWDEVIPTLQRMLEHPEELDKRQADLRAWYEKYMRSAVENFESFLLS